LGGQINHLPRYSHPPQKRKEFIKNLLHWEWEKRGCFAFKGMKQIGIIDGYRCGVIYRIECWLEALGIKYSIDPKIDKCIMHEKGACSGDLRVAIGG